MERKDMHDQHNRQRVPAEVYWILFLPWLLFLLVGVLLGQCITPRAIAAQAQTASPRFELHTYDTAESDTTQTATEPTTRYELSNDERAVIEQVVAAEASGEPYNGQAAVAECILNACEKDGIRPDRAIGKYGYTPNRIAPTQSIKDAVSAVFDRGETISGGRILYFYAPDRCVSKWHESQEFVVEIANHRFFAERQE